MNKDLKVDLNIAKTSKMYEEENESSYWILDGDFGITFLGAFYCALREYRKTWAVHVAPIK